MRFSEPDANPFSFSFFPAPHTVAWRLARKRKRPKNAPQFEVCHLQFAILNLAVVREQIRACVACALARLSEEQVFAVAA